MSSAFRKQIVEYTHGLQGLGHDLWAVVDREHNVGNASVGQCLDLMLDHGLVGELNERLGVGEGLQLLGLVFIQPCEGGVDKNIQEASDGFQTLRRE